MTPEVGLTMIVCSNIICNPTYSHVTNVVGLSNSVLVIGVQLQLSNLLLRFYKYKSHMFIIICVIVLKRHVFVSIYCDKAVTQYTVRNNKR